jgi:hypothetical protein
VIDSFPITAVVPKDRYNFDTDPNPVGPFIHFSGDSSHRSVNKELVDKRLKPLVQLALHREMAQAPLTPDGALGLARRYGCLGLRRCISSSYEELLTDPMVAGYGDCAESLVDWQVGILWMRVAVLCLDIVRSKSKEGIIEIVDKFNWRSSAMFSSPESCEYAATFFPNPLALGQLWIPELPGRDFKGLKMFADAMLDLILRFHLHRHLVIEVDVLGDRGIQLEAQTLFGAAMVGIASEFSGANSAGIPCPGCGKWFVPEHANVRHCCPSCKTQAYRKRRRTNPGKALLRPDRPKKASKLQVA